MWPFASSHSKVVWVKSVAGPSDLGIRNGFWRKMLEMISGEANSAIVRPYGVLRSAAGVLYLSDPGGGLVHCLDIVKGTYTVVSSQEGSPLRSPIGLAEDEAGRLYITDSDIGMVYRFDPQDGSLKPLLSVKLERPTGIAYDPRKKLLYVSDTVAGQIVVMNRNGVELRRIGSRGEGRANFNRPTDLAVDDRGQIYVTDSLNFRISVLTPEGQVVRQFGEPGDGQGYFSRPKGIAVDSDGNIYICDSLMDVVQIYDQNDELQLAFGHKGSGPGQFLQPSGLFIDQRDQLYVVDTYNQRIQIFRILAQNVDEDVDDAEDLFDKSLPPTL
jgi:sugar lactone lactonase YvrE